MLENIRIVLMNTTHPGNIGSAARAMKTMGLSKLYLVTPEKFPHPKANELASNAQDILDQAIVVPDIDAAIADCIFVAGTSARTRTIPWPQLTPRTFAEKTIVESSRGEIAILFGQEQSGLTNEALHRCHAHIHIPCNPDYSSLNLAAAVQVIAYELRVASLADVTPPSWDYDLATAAQMESFFIALEKVLIQMDFLDPKAPRQLMTRLRRFFARARPDIMEMNIFRGILTSIVQRILKK